MKMHYQDLVDEVFRSRHPHRTLRTVFDPGSTEWSETTITQKLAFLKKLLEADKLTLEEILDSYKHFYKYELANKAHVLDSLDDALAILLTNSIKKMN